MVPEVRMPARLAQFIVSDPCRWYTNYQVNMIHQFVGQLSYFDPESF